MPIFVYQCTKCGEKFERQMKAADYTSLVRCPKCGNSHPRRVYTPPATPGLGGGDNSPPRRHA